MNLHPTRDKFINLRKNFERVPILGEKIIPRFDPLHFFRLMIDDTADSFLFESGKGPEATARYTLMGRSNSKTLQANHDEFITTNGTREAKQGSPLSILEHLRFDPHGALFDYVPHFWGGWVGTIGYETAQWLDAVDLHNKDDLNLPLLYFFQVDRLWVYDHITQTLKIIVSQKCEDDPARYYDETIREIELCWQKAESTLNTPPAPAKSSRPAPADRNDAVAPRSNISKPQYVKMVEQTKRYIEEGDIYQANLSQRFEMESHGEALDLYENLREINPSPFSGYLKSGDMTLVSSSPERLVKIENGILETRPIAGTRPRGRNADEDNHLKTELLLNEKEQAEHLMLVDLERNDLGRVCEYGSVHVTEQMFVEQYSHVSHIVSNIRGRLKPDVPLKDILRAVFPGGTITGCPKIRCMEIIDELEPVARGPYSGSFGYIGFGGILDLNIIIRTIVLMNGKAYFHVGAGIVADSIPENEYQETLDKAAAMITVLTGKQDT